MDGKVVETNNVSPWTSIYTTINVNRPLPQPAADGSLGYYRPDDMSVGDLDGDGTYELILKWSRTNDRDRGPVGRTAPAPTPPPSLSTTLIAPARPNSSARPLLALQTARVLTCQRLDGRRASPSVTMPKCMSMPMVM